MLKNGYFIKLPISYFEKLLYAMPVLPKEISLFWLQQYRKFSNIELCHFNTTQLKKKENIIVMDLFLVLSCRCIDLQNVEFDSIASWSYSNIVVWRYQYQDL